MGNLNEKQAVQILMRNLKGSKNKPDSLLQVAESVNFLKKTTSLNDMKRMFDVSSTMLNQINRLNKLNDFSKKLLQNGKLGIEKGYLLARLNGKRQDEAAKEIVNLSSHDSRTFIDLLIKNEKVSVSDCTQQFNQKISKKMDLLVIPMPYGVFNELERQSKKKRLDPHDLAFKILEEYLNEHKK